MRNGFFTDNYVCYSNQKKFPNYRITSISCDKAHLFAPVFVNLYDALKM